MVTCQLVSGGYLKSEAYVFFNKEIRSGGDKTRWSQSESWNVKIPFLKIKNKKKILKLFDLSLLHLHLNKKKRWKSHSNCGEGFNN